MKGTVISLILSIVVILSLNHRVLSIFFKIKRQRLYKSNNFYDTDNMEKVSNISSARKKRLKETKTKPPIK